MRWPRRPGLGTRFAGCVRPRPARMPSIPRRGSDRSAASPSPGCMSSLLQNRRGRRSASQHCPRRPPKRHRHRGIARQPEARRWLSHPTQEYRAPATCADPCTRPAHLDSPLRPPTLASVAPVEPVEPALRPAPLPVLHDVRELCQPFDRPPHLPLAPSQSLARQPQRRPRRKRPPATAPFQPHRRGERRSFQSVRTSQSPRRRCQEQRAGTRQAQDHAEHCLVRGPTPYPSQHAAVVKPCGGLP